MQDDQIRTITNNDQRPSQRLTETQCPALTRNIHAEDATTKDASYTWNQHIICTHQMTKTGQTNYCNGSGTRKVRKCGGPIQRIHFFGIYSYISHILRPWRPENLFCRGPAHTSAHPPPGHGNDPFILYTVQNYTHNWNSSKLTLYNPSCNQFWAVKINQQTTYIYSIMLKSANNN